MLEKRSGLISPARHCQLYFELLRHSLPAIVLHD